MQLEPMSQAHQGIGKPTAKKLQEKFDIETVLDLQEVLSDAHEDVDVKRSDVVRSFGSKAVENWEAVINKTAPGSAPNSPRGAYL